RHHAAGRGIEIPFSSNTPYVNTIAVDDQPDFPGDRAIERKIKSLVRWNAMAMVVRGAKLGATGGHIATYASAATLYEVGFNHFFRGRQHPCGGDMIYFQGHASPGVYARAFLEGRFDEGKLDRFRRELQPGGGLSSYPHPWLMPDFWQFPTVSMGLGPITSIYQARFNRYLEDRGLKEPTDAKVWCFIGDGEVDEPETLGAINLATREKLDNLIFVVNCNLQRLDGPVRGNGKIIQELEGVFRGAGWNVVKCIWGTGWDRVFAADVDSAVARRLESLVDGQFQRLATETGAYVRAFLCDGHPDVAAVLDQFGDDEIEHLRRGGHDPVKVYAAYKNAVDNVGTPTVVLAKTIKGYGMGSAGEGKNIAHQAKKLKDDDLLKFVERFHLPIAADKVLDLPYCRLDEGSPEMAYVRERRQALGGPVPSRAPTKAQFQVPPLDVFAKTLMGSEKEVSTTFTYVQMLMVLLKDRSLGKYIVPIIPDEARTFGMDGLFNQIGIYSHQGQLYEPVDAGDL
ncbi:MAG: pyruvate dehydrogenase (acetyl-transferring), homodimeric type, partial [Planctomycetia bacterium]